MCWLVHSIVKFGLESREVVVFHVLSNVIENISHGSSILLLDLHFRISFQVENERSYHRRAAELLDQIQAHVRINHLYIDI